jgi:hypothetical protein
MRDRPCRLPRIVPGTHPGRAVLPRPAGPPSGQAVARQGRAGPQSRPPEPAPTARHHPPAAGSGPGLAWLANALSVPDCLREPSARQLIAGTRAARRGLGSQLLVILTAGTAIGVAAWGFVLCPRSRASGPSARPLASSTLDPPPAQRGFRAPRSRGCPHHALTGSDAAARRFRASKTQPAGARRRGRWLPHQRGIGRRINTPR